MRALKSAREERLNTAANVDREERKNALFEKQAMMDKAQRAKARAAKSASQASLLNPKRKVCAWVAAVPGTYLDQSIPRFSRGVDVRARIARLSPCFRFQGYFV